LCVCVLFFSQRCMQVSLEHVFALEPKVQLYTYLLTYLLHGAETFLKS